MKSRLIESGVCHADETRININGKRVWLHCVSNGLWSYYRPHEKRGLEAMEEMGVLPHFKGILCHDHWKSYFKLYTGMPCVTPITIKHRYYYSEKS